MDSTNYSDIGHFGCPFLLRRRSPTLLSALGSLLFTTRPVLPFVGSIFRVTFRANRFKYRNQIPAAILMRECLLKYAILSFTAPGTRLRCMKTDFLLLPCGASKHQDRQRAFNPDTVVYICDVSRRKTKDSRMHN